MTFDFGGTSVKKYDDFSVSMVMSPNVPVVLELVLISSQECFMLAIFPSSAFSDSCYSLKLSTGRVFTQWKSGPPLPPPASQGELSNIDEHTTGCLDT